MTIAPGTPRRSGRSAEILVWTAVAFLVLSWVCIHQNPPLSNDSYQYLSEARHLLTEHTPSTSLVFFDVERAHGQIPAPLTTFPPGYPVAIAMLGNLGIGLESAGRLISCIALALTAGLLAAVLIGTDVVGVHRQLLMLFFVANAITTVYGGSLISEPLFTFLLTAVIAGYIWIEYRIAAARPVVVPALLANLAAAALVWVRYAGYFVLAALFCYAVFQLIRSRSRQRTILLAAVLIPILSAVSLLARNLSLTGNWKGGNELAVHNRLVPLISNYIISHVHLFLGDHAVRFGAPEAVLVLGVFVLTAIALIAFTGSDGGQFPAIPHSLANAFLLTAFCVVIYTLAMLYVGMHTVVSFGERMFMPLLPLYCLLFAWAISVLYRRISIPRIAAWLTAGLAITAIGYAATNARDLAMPRRLASHEALAVLYAMPAQNGQPLIDWVRHTVPPGQALLSEEGQATGFLLDRPAVGMTTSEYSATQWECSTIQPLMNRFHIQYVVLYRYLSAANSNSAAPSAAVALLPESHFVADSLAGHPPCGFVVAAWNPAVLVLRTPPQPGKMF